MDDCVVTIVIPALNEQEALPGVLRGLRLVRDDGFTVREIIVADNGSTDATARVAASAGARVVSEPRRGYGAACLAAIDALRVDPPAVIVFIDADGSDEPAELPDLLRPLVRGEADLVIGSRALGTAEAGALTPVQSFGNALAAFLMRILFGARFTDLGPFRAIRWTAYESLQMRDRDYGWTVEMQTRALRAGLRCVEVPVSYRQRAGGRSKVTGTIRGVVGAGWKILFTIARVRLGG